MERSTVAPLAATLQLAVILLIGPVWLIDRLSSPLLPIEASDILLTAWMVAWSFVFKALLERDDALDPLKFGRGTPMWFAHRLVDQSLLGVGTVSVVDAPMALTALAPPRDLSPAELPPAQPVFDFGPDIDFDDAHNKVMPTLTMAEPEAPRFTETAEYLVGRGDTFWSIAEATLGDGRDWTVLLAMNLGREVAPGTTLTDTDELRIGWSILVPVLEVDTEEER